jgi:hypothetical protein
MDEIWKPIIGYEGLFEVSSLGRVKNCRFNKFKKQRIRSGYYSVTLFKDKKLKSLSIHRIMAEAFLENRKECVNHIDGNKLNNNLNNLEWVSYRENAVHRDLKKDTKTGKANIILHSNSFQVRVRHEKKYVQLGSYKKIEDAVLARDNFYKLNNIVNKYL